MATAAPIYDVRDEPRGPQIFLSRPIPASGRCCPGGAGDLRRITRSAVARDPGSRAKMASDRPRFLDRPGACVGMRGSACRRSCRNCKEKSTSFWSPQSATFVVNALAPAEVTKVVMDEEAGRVEVVVPDERLSLASTCGQNVRLASQPTRWTSTSHRSRS
jgi:N utilization substance protein A